MKNTFKFWLLANLGVIVAFITVIIVTVMVSIVEFPPERDKFDDVAIILAFTLFLAAFFCFPLKKMVEISGRYFAFIGAGILIFVFKEDIVEDGLYLSKLPMLYSIVLGCATVISALISYFIYVNFDEVVSRRMLYRSSAVEMFDSQIKYTIGQFMNVSSAIFGLVFIIAGVRLLLEVYI